MKITEERVICMDDLRNLCIKNGWFTHGNSEEYGRFLRMTRDTNGDPINMTVDHFQKMALEIMRYSDFSGFDDPKRFLVYIIYELCRICRSVFTVEENDR